MKRSTEEFSFNLGPFLDGVRAAFEPLIANRGGSDAFAACGDAVHDLEAALETAGLHAAAPLLDEIPLALARIAGEPFGRRAETLRLVNDALERIRSARSHYSDPAARIESDDIGLIDELRVLRGAPLLSAHAALASDLIAAIPVRAPRIPLPELVRGLRDLRRRFEQALLAWLRSATRRVDFDPLTRVFDQTAALCAPAAPALLWAAAGALGELIGQGERPTPASVRRVVTRLDGELRRLTERHGEALVGPVNESLLRALLYRVETHPGGGPRSTALRAQLHLGTRFAPARVILAAAEAIAVAGLREAVERLRADPGADQSGADQTVALTGVADALALAGAGLARRRVLLYAAAARGGDRSSAARQLGGLADALEQGGDPGVRPNTPPSAVPAVLRGLDLLDLKVGAQCFALPVTGIVTVLTLDPSRTRPATPPTLSYGGRDYPLHPLAALLDATTPRPATTLSGEAVLVDVNGQRAALLVERVRPRPPLPARAPEGLLATVPWLTGISARSGKSPLLHLNLAALLARCGDGGERI